MASTIFTKNITTIAAGWLNDVNTITYSQPNKSATVSTTPASGTKVFIESSDGGWFIAKTGASAGTYSDDGGSYCGTVFIHTGGDGSSAWVRDYNGAVDSAWYGLTGTSELTTELQNLVDTKDFIDLVNGGWLIDSSAYSVVVTKDNTIINGDNTSAISSSTLNRVPLTAGDQTDTRPSNVGFSSLVLSNNPANTDDFPALRLGGVAGGVVSFNHVTSAFYGIGIKYSRLAATAGQERRSSQIRTIGNLAETSGLAIEYFANINCISVGNVANKKGVLGGDHAFRYTGYGLDEVTNSAGSDLRYYGNAHAAIASNNYDNGVSQQLGNFANAHSGYSLISLTNGFLFTVNDTTVGSQSRNNTYSAIAIDECNIGISLEKTERHVFSALTISNFALRGISQLVASSAGTFGTGKYNRFDGLISEQDSGATHPAVFIEGDNNRIDLTLADITGASGCEIVGDYNVITIVGGELSGATAPILLLSGNSNIVNVAGNAITANINIKVSGDKNDLTVNLDNSGAGGLVQISGTNNVLRGICELDTIASGNDVTGVKDASRRATLSATTDASGDLTVTHGLIGSDTSFRASAIMSTVFGVLSIHTETATTFKVRAFDAAGAVIASTAITINWFAEKDYG